MKIGLTGGMGSGKSLVLSLLARRRIPVLQTDDIGHQVLKSTQVSAGLAKQFGKGILGKNKKIDRSKLAKIVFRDPGKQKILGKMVHPLIRREVDRWVRFQKKKHHPIVVVEVPLLFENGFYRFFDGTLSVSASRALRQKRLLERGWALSEIRRREKFQWPQSRKNRKADWIIYNEGSRKKLKKAVQYWLDGIQKSEKINSTPV